MRRTWSKVLLEGPSPRSSSGKVDLAGGPSTRSSSQVAEAAVAPLPLAARRHRFPPTAPSLLGTTSIGVPRRVGSMEPRARRGGKHRVELPQLGEKVGLRRSHSARRPRDAPANGGSCGHERRESAHVANHHRRSSCQVLGQVLVPGPRARSSLQVLAPGPRPAPGPPHRTWHEVRRHLHGGPHRRTSQEDLISRVVCGQQGSCVRFLLRRIKHFSPCSRSSRRRARRCCCSG